MATGGVNGFATIITTDDAGKAKVIQNGGAPTLGFAWSDVSRLSPLTIKDGNGRGPTAPGEVAIDVGTAEAQGFKLGDSIKVQATGKAEDFTIVGLMSFGDQDTLLGATLSAFEMTEAQRILSLQGELTSIGVAAKPNVSPSDLATRINEVLPEGVTAITGQAQQANELNDITEGLSIINTVLLAFAAVAVFVGSFIIQNTFRIIVTQRTRELALLRAIGATGRQVVIMVVVEALIVALFASAIGVDLGGRRIIKKRAALNAAGLAIPPGNLVVLARTIIVGMATGVVVTVV